MALDAGEDDDAHDTDDDDDDDDNDAPITTAAPAMSLLCLNCPKGKNQPMRGKTSCLDDGIRVKNECLLTPFKSVRDALDGKQCYQGTLLFMEKVGIVKLVKGDAGPNGKPSSHWDY
jgi:hypothetical protein